MKEDSGGLARRGQVDDVRPRLEPDSLSVERIPLHADEVRTMTGPPSIRSAEQRLTPRRPPGRSNRKARTFAEEIRRLRAEGHSFEVIREALADAGVIVSNSTVQREAARGLSPSQTTTLSGTDSPPG